GGGQPERRGRGGADPRGAGALRTGDLRPGADGDGRRLVHAADAVERDVPERRASGGADVRVLHGGVRRDVGDRHLGQGPQVDGSGGGGGRRRGGDASRRPVVGDGGGCAEL